MKVRLRLSALTRLEFIKEVEVPDGTSKEELDQMVEDLYEETDGGDYYDDPHYWEKGNCTWEEINPVE